MRKLVLVTSLAAVLAAPTLAAAQDRCQRSNSGDRVAGTVVGAVAGALLGSAIAGRKDSTAGAVVGGTTGAVIGNQIAKKSGQPCPEGYYEVREAPAYASPPPAYRPGSYDYRAGAYDRRQFWAGAPQDIGQRINFLEDRVSRGRADGSISRREADHVRDLLNDVRREEDRLRRPSGRISPRDYAYLDDRLDNVSRQIQWARANDRYDRRR